MTKQKVRVLFSETNPNEHWLQCSECGFIEFKKGDVKRFLETLFDYWESIDWHCGKCGHIEETCKYVNPSPPLPPIW